MSESGHSPPSILGRIPSTRTYLILSKVDWGGLPNHILCSTHPLRVWLGRIPSTRPYLSLSKVRIMWQGGLRRLAGSKILCLNMPAQSDTCPIGKQSTAVEQQAGSKARVKVATSLLLCPKMPGQASVCAGMLGHRSRLLAARPGWQWRQVLNSTTWL